MDHLKAINQYLPSRGDSDEVPHCVLAVRSQVAPVGAGDKEPARYFGAVRGVRRAGAVPGTSPQPVNRQPRFVVGIVLHHTDRQIFLQDHQRRVQAVPCEVPQMPTCLQVEHIEPSVP